MNQRKYASRLTVAVFLGCLLGVNVLSASAAAITINDTVATVNDRPITKLDIEQMREKIPQMKGVLPVKAQNDAEILDYLIEKQLIEQIADEQSLKAPQDKLEERIQALVDANNVPNAKALDERLKKRGSSLEQFREEFTHQLLIFQVMNLYVPTTPPARGEIQAWYNNNRDKLGKEVIIKIISLASPFSVAEELKVNQRMVAIRTQIAKNPAAFEAIAQKNGLQVVTIGWKNLAELDQLIAGNAFQLQGQVGRGVSPVFKQANARYYSIVQLVAIRDVTMETVQNRIFGLLYAQKQERAFLEWMKARKRQAAITFFQTPAKP